MSGAIAAARPTSLSQRMGGFERQLTLWVTLCIVAGTGLGYAVP